MFNEYIGQNYEFSKAKEVKDSHLVPTKLDTKPMDSLFEQICIRTRKLWALFFQNCPQGQYFRLFTFFYIANKIKDFRYSSTPS